MTVLYEHPLNERIRNYLKLEQLFAQLNSSQLLDVHLGHPVYFNALFSVVDTLERNDIRGDLIKDLEKLEQNLVLWSKAPDINNSALEDTLKQTVELICKLKGNAPIWCQLKEDKFLSSLKQRFAIQGGSSTFDLPQLQYWLYRATKTTSSDMQRWSALLHQIESALALILKFTRLKAEFDTIITESGFYQDNGEGLALLRIKVPKDADYFPTVSGNRFRYSIRFMLPCNESGRRYSNQATSFELARC